MKEIKLNKLILTAMITALVAVLSPIAIPMPIGIPVTLQTFCVSFAGFFLGYKLGVVSILIYILLGAIGLPVFSGYNGGLGVLTSYTGGFIFGFIFLALFSGFKFKLSNYLQVVSGIIGLLLCHALGAIQFGLLSNISIIESIVLVSVPYLIKDIASIIAAFIVVRFLIVRKVINF